MDELDQIRQLAGVGKFKGLTEYRIDPNSNISVTGTEKAQIQREKNTFVSLLNPSEQKEVQTQKRKT